MISSYVSAGIIECPPFIMINSYGKTVALMGSSLKMAKLNMFHFLGNFVILFPIGLIKQGRLHSFSTILVVSSFECSHF